jgi:1-acyl-sn-glycerol-3-phosphate acyltransferase
MPAPSAAAAAVEALDAAVTRAEERVSGVASRLRDLAAAEASGQHARELAAIFRRLWPALRPRLETLELLRRLFDGPGPLDPYGMDPELVARAGPALDLLVDGWWRTEVRGLERVPAGAALIVANHGGRFHWDALVLGHLLRRAGRELRPLLDEHAMRGRVGGRAAARLGAVEATPENALRLLESGRLAAVFPEGSRNDDRTWADRYRIRRFGRGGLARIAMQAGVPVVPCAIVGSEETAAPFARPGWIAEALDLPLLAGAPGVPLGPLASLPLPSRWSVRFGDPISPEPAAAAEDEAAVIALTETVRATLQRMLDEDVASRPSVYL